MKRLDYLLTFIPQNTGVIADIGTDHGYLAIKALKKQLAKTIYATDIAQEPLNQAKINLARAHLADTKQIHLIKSNGLEFVKQIPETKIDYVIIAGLGTKTIHQIVSQHHHKINRYLLLSNNEISNLRRWSHDNNFLIEREDFFYDHQRPYWLILINTKEKTKPINNFDFGNWEDWYQKNNDYRNYLTDLRARHLSYNQQINDSKKLKQNKNYIQKIEKYLQQWN